MFNLCRTAGPGRDRAVDEDDEHDDDGGVGHPLVVDPLLAPRRLALFAPQLGKVEVVVGLEAGVVGAQVGRQEVVIVTPAKIFIGWIPVQVIVWVQDGNMKIS